MTPLVQTLIVVALVAAALVYVGRRAWATLGKRKSDDKPCGTGCNH